MREDNYFFENISYICEVNLAMNYSKHLQQKVKKD